MNKEISSGFSVDSIQQDLTGQQGETAVEQASRGRGKKKAEGGAPLYRSRCRPL